MFYRSYKNVRLIIYYNKFKTSNLIIFNNSSPSTELLDRKNVVYMFKCPMGDCLQRKLYACRSYHYNSFKMAYNTP